MYQNLENYLDEISRYLAVKEGVQEILSEIRSHILEKTEAEFGSITEENVGSIISSYGKPHQVAAKYLEEIEIISPIFKRHLFLYTGILFVCHLIMIAAASLFHYSMVVFPFLYIPNMNVWQMMLYIPTTLLYDLGMVAVFLYLVTQRKKELRLPWPKLLARGESRFEMKKPNIIFMVFLVIFFVLFMFMFLRFGTIFFASMNNPVHPVPMFDQGASLYYSLLFLAMIACEVVGYAMRFINRSRWIDLIKNFVILILLQFVWNSPVKTGFAIIPGIDLKNNALAFVFIITIVFVIKFIKSLILVVANQLAKKR
jgi:hypothetical protein